MLKPVAQDVVTENKKAKPAVDKYNNVLQFIHSLLLI